MHILAKLDDALRLLFASGAALWMAWWLHSRDWPLISWLPAAGLAFFGVFALWVFGWFLNRKLTYPIFARRTKLHLRDGGDGWPNRRPPRNC